MTLSLVRTLGGVSLSKKLTTRLAPPIDSHPSTLGIYLQKLTIKGKPNNQILH